MQPFKRFKPLLSALLLGVAFVGTSAPARATFEFDIKVTDNGVAVSPTTSYVVGSPGNYQLTFLANDAYYTVDIEGNISNSPGDPHGAKLTLTSRITADPRGTGSHVLDVTMTATDYNVPNGPDLNLTSTAAAQATSVLGGTGTAGTVTFQSWVDPTDVPYGKGTLTPGVQSATLKSDNVLTSLQPDPGIALGGNATVYSMTVESTYDLAPGVTAVLNGNAIVHHPAPPGVVLALIGLPLVGLGWLRRRRRRAA